MHTFLIFRIPHSNFRIPDTLYHIPRVKLRQNGIVSFSIRLAAFLARGGAYMKLHHQSFFFDQTGRFFGRRLG
jgi:hypothetical protein